MGSVIYRSFSSRDQEAKKAKEKKEPDVGEMGKMSNKAIFQERSDLGQTGEQSAEEKNEDRKKETENGKMKSISISNAIFQERSDTTQTEEQTTKKKSVKNDKLSPEKPKKASSNRMAEKLDTALKSANTASTKSIELSSGRIESRRPKSNNKRKRSIKSSVDVNSGKSDICHHSFSPEECTLIDKISDNGDKPIIVTVPLPENIIIGANRDSEGIPAGVESILDRKSLSSENLVSKTTENDTKRVTRRSTRARKESQAKSRSKVMNRRGDGTRMVEPIIDGMKKTRTSESTHRPKKGSTKVETRCSPRKKSKDVTSKIKKTVKKKVTTSRPQQQPTRIIRRIQKQELSICPDCLCPHLSALNKYGTHLTKQFKGKEPNYTGEVEVRCKHCDVRIDEIDGKNIVDKLHEHILVCASVQVLPRQVNLFKQWHFISS
jgi:hypothetical protein